MDHLHTYYGAQVPIPITYLPIIVGTYIYTYLLWYLNTYLIIYYGIQVPTYYVPTCLLWYLDTHLIIYYDIQVPTYYIPTYILWYLDTYRIVYYGTIKFDHKFKYFQESWRNIFSSWASIAHEMPKLVHYLHWRLCYI